MKKLYLNRKQALALAHDLKEYSNFKDSSDRELFEGFELSFGDLFATKLQDGESFEVTPIPGFIEISDE